MATEEMSPNEVLQVPPRAPQEEVRKAFRKLALQWHPDKHRGEEKERAELEFKRILWAYEALTKQTRNSFSEFCDQWTAYGAEWTQFYDLNEDPPDHVCEEDWEEIQRMWSMEDTNPIPPPDTVDWHVIARWSDIPSSLVGSKGRDPQPAVDRDVNSRVAFWSGSLLNLNVDCVVNSADIFLANTNSGVLNRALHRAAGEKLAVECKLHGKSATGNVTVTRGYSLPAKYVIHACAPKTKRARDLSLCYSRALYEASKQAIQSIAFPCLSVGAGFPLEDATNIALGTVRYWLDRHPNQIECVIFCVYREEELRCYQQLLPWYFPKQGHVYLS